MTSERGTILPIPLEDEETSDEVKRVLAWIRNCVEEDRFADLARELLPRVLAFPDSDQREALLRYAVEWFVMCDEFAHALSLVTSYPTAREGSDETEGIGLLLLFIANQSKDPSHVILARDFVRQHEKVLKEMDAIDLFMELAELTRDTDDVARVQCELEDLSDEANLFFRLRIVALTQDEKELSKLCLEIKGHDDPEEAAELQGLLEPIIAKLPKAKMNRLIPLLPSEIAQKRTRELSTNYSLN